MNFQSLTKLVSLGLHHIVSWLQNYWMWLIGWLILLKIAKNYSKRITVTLNVSQNILCASPFHHLCPLFKLSGASIQSFLVLNWTITWWLNPTWLNCWKDQRTRESVSHYWNYFLCIIGFPILWFFIYLSAEMMSINRHFEVVTLGKIFEEMQC